MNKIRSITASILALSCSNTHADDLFNAASWDPSVAYHARHIVQYNDKLFFSRFWVKGKSPDVATHRWMNVVINKQSDEWDIKRIYFGGDVVRHNGIIYTAALINKELEPNTLVGLLFWIPLGDADLTGPTVSSSLPVNNGAITSALSPIYISIEDEHLSTDPISYIAQSNSSNVEITPSWENNRLKLEPAQIWEEGSLNLSIDASDRYGNHTNRQFEYIVDYSAPNLIAINPDQGASIDDALQVLTFEIKEANPKEPLDDAFIVSVNNQPFTGIISVIDEQLILTPTAEWIDGNLTISITALDEFNNTAEYIFDYQVETNLTLQSQPQALPEIGNAPLSVLFTPQAFTSKAITSYSWDFDGDGTYDRSETVGRNQSYTYHQPGTYNAALKVTDNTGKTNIGFITINVNNSGPTATVSADKTNGRIPLTVTFTVNAQDNEGIANVEWDFDGDGEIDTSSSALDSVSYTYNETGTYQAKVIVTDSLGMQSIVNLPNIEIRAASVESPSVTLSIPESATAPAAISLTAATYLVDYETVDKVEWDFNGDGIIDLTGSLSTTHTFTKIGTLYPSVTITDSNGNTAKDIRKIIINENFSLSISNNTIDPFNTETASIQTNLNGDVQTSLVIENHGGVVVKTLVPWTLRQAGSYSDSWDGKGANDTNLPQADYYAVMLYKKDGIEKRFDLRPSTSGTAYNPSRTRMPSSFSPYDNKPLTISFTLPEPSEVTAFMGLYRTNTRMVTFLNREPLGKGTHTIIWNAIGDDGKHVSHPSGNPFLFGIWGYKSGKNTIYLNSGAHITSFKATPSIVVPDSRTENNNGFSQLALNLNKSANIELTVTDITTGSVVRTHLYTDIANGQQSLEWDVKNDNDEWVAPGKYRLGIRSIDNTGYTSPFIYTVQRVYY